MTTRRTLLGLAGASVLAACSPRTPQTRTRTTDLLFVTTDRGLLVVDTATGAPVLSTPAALATSDWTRLVTVERDGTGTRLSTREAKTGQELSGARVRDTLTPRVVSPDGQLVALATPGGSTTYRPAGRARTTIVVADASGERQRFDLPGNLEPEAFSKQRDTLFVLDYQPPTAPDAYRVRALGLLDGVSRPLLTREKVPVPPGAEESMRGEGRQAIYDPIRHQLYTLYTHQPDHEHTRDLLDGGARAGRPDVHAFVHTLNLEIGFAYCIDLPAPFGESDPTGHAIAMLPGGARLYVFDAAHGKVAVIDPGTLEVRDVHDFPGTAGAAAAAVTSSGLGQLVGAGQHVRSLPNGPSWQTPSAVRGMALCEQRLWVGQDGEAVAYSTVDGTPVARVAVPGLVAVKHATLRL